MEASPFNKLAAELRNRIYEFALVIPKDIEVQIDDDTCPPCATDEQKKGHPHMLALAATCKQMRQEALPIFLGKNNIKILAGSRAMDEPKMAAFCISGWYSTIGEYAPCLKSLEVSMAEPGLLWADEKVEFLKQLKRMFKHKGLQLSATADLSMSRLSECWQELYGMPKLSPVKLDYIGATLSANRASVQHGLQEYKQWATEWDKKGKCVISLHWLIQDLEEIARTAEEFLDLLDQDPAWSWKSE